MNDHLYIEEIIEFFFPSSSSDEANNVIKELREKNGSLQEEVRKLRREKEIQSIRLCEIMEQKKKKKKQKWKEKIMRFNIYPSNRLTSSISSPMQMKKS